MKLALGKIGYDALIILALAVSLSCAQDPSSTPQVQDFNWTSITPSANLTWSSCYSTFQCARLLVPFDYNSPSGDQFALAIIKVPAAVSPDDPTYKGPILTNPGGPGGSGVALLLADGKVFQSVVGNEFDIIGFDPRGVGQTTPNLNVFRSQFQALAFLQESGEALNATPSSLGRVFALEQIVGNLALQHAQTETEHMSTPDVATDMLTIVKAMGRDKLQYVGFSYGTVLGVTFAAMFPNNVERLALDGVVDSQNYYAALWNNNLLDTDMTLARYYSDCVKAGPSVCPIWKPTVSQINQRINALLDRLKIAPISFANATTGEIGLIDYSTAKSVLFQNLYTPHQTGPTVASAFAALEAGDAQPMWNLTGATLEEAVEAQCSFEAANIDVDDVSGTAIACGDGPPIHSSLDELRQFYADMARQSVFAEVWTTHLSCAAWKVQAKNKFTGKFSAKTSFPLLFIANTADPVTPISGARKMSSGFPGSVVLQQDSPGHTSVSAVSPCTLNFYRQYFRNGTLPAPGTVCPVVGTSFSNTPTNFTIRAHVAGVEDEALNKVLVDAAVALSNRRRFRRFI